MGRRCIIEGCPSGRNPDIKRRKQLGIRQISIFQVPKCQDLRRKWSKALVTELNLGNYVCENHFNDMDIKKEDKTIMPDGMIVVIPLQHYGLHHDAVPSLRPIKCENGVTNQKDTDACTQIEEEVHSNQSNPKSGSTTTSSLQQHVTHFEANSNNNENVPDIKGYAHPAAKRTTLNSSEEIGRSEELLDNTEKESDNNEGRDNLPGSETPESISEGLEKPALETDEFNIHHLRQCLKVTPLSKGWAWMTDPADMNALMLVRVDLRTCKTILHMKVHANMSITTHAHDGGQKINLNTKIKNVDDLLALTRVINEKRLCVGTGIEQESRANQCIAVLNPEEYAINVRDPRCTHCRILRRLLQNRYNRPKVDYAAKYARSRRELDLQRRKIKRLQKQVFREQILKMIAIQRVKTITTT